MSVRFLADANFNQKIVTGLLLREPRIDFALPQTTIPEGLDDPAVLNLARISERIVVTHDVTTMPHWFTQSLNNDGCAGLILVPAKMAIPNAIEDLLLIWNLTEPGEWRNRLEWLPL